MIQNTRNPIAAWASLMLLLLAAAGCTETAVRDNQLAFVLNDLDGNPVSSAEARFKGKVLLVDIWGAWCPPCRNQIPHLIRWQEKYRDKGLEIIGIDFEMYASGQREHIRAIKGFVKETRINYLILLGGQTTDVYRALPAIRDFSGFPTTIFIGRDGLVKDVMTGFFDGEAPKLEAFIEELLEEPAP